jgi:hypothetical protein
MNLLHGLGISGNAVWRGLSKRELKDLGSGGASSFMMRPPGRYTSNMNVEDADVITPYCGETVDSGNRVFAQQRIR